MEQQRSQIRFCTSADGVRIAYATAGEGPALVHSSGWVGVEGDWSHPEGVARVEALSKRRLFVEYDERGVGASQRQVSDFSLEAQVADLAAVVDHLKLDRFDLFGLPTSAFVCVAYAALHPERVSHLVLFAGSRSGREAASQEAIEGLVELVRGNWSLARRAIAEVLYPTGPLELQQWLSGALRQSISPEVTVEYLRLQFNVDVTSYLPRVKAPTLVLHRRGDRNVPVEAGRALAAAIPDARFVVLEGDVDDWFYGYEQYLHLMLEFLAEGEEARPRPSAPSSDGLTGREVEVLQLIAAGKSNKEIAAALVISTNTVDRHVSNIFAKTGAANRAEAASYAVRHELA